MPYCEFPRDFMLFDVTPVENLFLMEHMPHAPGDFVRVYLYGLMLCRYPSEDASAETVARALGIKPEEVTDAFRYWEQKGLVMRLSDRPPRYQYISLQRALLSGDDPQDGAYQYRDFFQQLQYFLGADRLIAPQEQAKAVDWIETLKLPEDVVLLMVETQVEKVKKAGKSLRYLFADMDKIAEKLADEEIKDVPSAKAWFVKTGEAGEIAKLAYIVNVVIDEDKKTVAAFAGDFKQAHAAGVAFLRQFCEVQAIPGDIVITSNGGAPLDQNLYQCVKGLTAAEASAKPGAVLIMCAEMADGSGGEGFYRSLLECESPAQLYATYCATPQNETVPDQWESQVLARMLMKHRVIFVTRKEMAQIVRDMKMEYAETLEEALAMARETVGEAGTVTAIPNGISVIVNRE